jgi:hypothetical protein
MRILILGLIGAGAGAIASVIWGQAALEYWATPPFQIPGCDYRPAIRWAMHYQLVLQGSSIVAGAILLPALYGLFFRRRTREPSGAQ